LDVMRESYVTFIVRRWFRLFPILFLTFVAGVLLNGSYREGLTEGPWADVPWIQKQREASNLHEAYFAENCVAHLLMLHGLVPVSWWPDSTGAFIGPGWSISTEWQFYLIAPLLYALMQRPWGRVVASCGVLLCMYLTRAERFHPLLNN